MSDDAKTMARKLRLVIASMRTRAKAMGEIGRTAEAYESRFAATTLEREFATELEQVTEDE